MNRPSAGFSLEAHYYDGGLKIENFPSRRPVVGLPASEHVIYSDMQSLGRDDFIFELCLFQSDCKENWLWLGCYVASVDRQFGDRSNYVSVGIWMKELVAIDCKAVLISLSQAAVLLNKDGMTNTLKQNFLKLESVSRERYLLARDELPAGLIGIARSNLSNSSHREFDIVGTVEQAVTTIEAALLNLQLAPTPFVAESKIRFRVSPTSRKSNSSAALPAVSDLLLPLVLSLPTVVEATAHAVIHLKEQLSQLKSANESMSDQLDAYRQAADRIVLERDTLKLKVTEQGEELERLRALPYTTISNQLREISGRLDILMSAPRQPVTRVEPVRQLGATPTTSKKSSENDLAIQLAKYFLIAALLIAVVGAITYSILEMSWSNFHLPFSK